MALSDNEKLQALGSAWVTQTGELRKCNGKVNSLKEWKEKALELQGRYDEVVEINP